MNAIPFEYDDTDYFGNNEGDYNQADTAKSYIQDLIDINSLGKIHQKGLN